MVPLSFLNVALNLFPCLQTPIGYSPRILLLLTNNLFTKRDEARGKYYIGVTKYRNKFKAQLNKGIGKSISLGTYDTPEEAFLAYKKAKEAYIKEVAEEYKGKIDNRLYEALMNYEVEITD